MRLVRFMAVLATLCAAAAGRPSAQSATGAITGWVADDGGHPLTGATVTITERATNQRRVLDSDARGWFQAAQLPVGAYDVRAHYRQAMQGGIAVSVSSGRTTALRVRVPAAGAIAIEDSVPAFGSAIETLPIANRQVLDLARLSPGATVDARLGTLAFDGQRGTLTQYTVDGLADGNRFLGRPPDPRLVPGTIGQDAVNELVVSAFRPSADTGSGIGTVAVVTRSGANTAYGSGFWSMRDDALEATSIVERTRGIGKTPSHADQFGGTLGGPLRRSRAFFYASYDGDRRSTTNVFALDVPPAAPLTPSNLQAIASLAPFVADWTPRATQHAGAGRLDLRFAAHQVSIRGRDRRFTATDLPGATPQVSLDHSGGLLVRTRALAATVGSTFGRSLLNEVRAQVGRDHELHWSNSPYPETIVYDRGSFDELAPGRGVQVIAFGRDPLTPRDTAIRFTQVADTVTWIRGAHTLSAGGDLLVDRITDDFPRGATGSYTFHNLAGLPFGRPSSRGDSYMQTFAVPGTSGWTTRPDTTFSAFFLQEGWRPSPTFSVDAGLRYERQRFAQPGVRNPSPALAAARIDTSVIDTDTNNWAPRAGVAWRPRSDRVTVSGGTGIFYGRTPALLAAAAHANNGLNLRTYTLGGMNAPRYPATFDAAPSVGLTPPTIQVFARGFQQPRFVHTYGGATWTSPVGTLLDAYLVVARGAHLTRAIDRAVQTGERRVVAGVGVPPAAFDVAQPVPAPSADAGRIVVFEGRGEARYAGLTLRLSRRVGQTVQVYASYTLSRVVDTVNDATATLPGTADDARMPAHPGNAGLDRATGDGDQPHQLVATASWSPQPDHGGLLGGVLARWTLASVLTARSGLPYSAYIDGDANGDGNARNDVAVWPGRNARRMPAQVSLDVRAIREIPLRSVRLQLIADVFNLFDARNVTAVTDLATQIEANGFSGGATGLVAPAAIGRPLATSGPRSAQLGVRATF